MNIGIAAIALSLAMAPLGVMAADAETQGEAIAHKMDQAESGYGNFSATVEMLLRDRKGRESVRQMRYLTLEQQNDGDKSLIVFEQPSDIRGVAALTYAHRTEPDDQWLYLPNLRRVKRISSANQAGPFVGSEFAYEDIGSQELPKYSYRYLRDDMHDGKVCHLIERDPVNPDSGYSKQVVWVEVDRSLPWRIDYYDRKGELLKIKTYIGYRRYEDRFWRPTQIEMVNQQVGKSTVVTYSNYRFNNDLSDQDFSVTSLKRLR